MYLPTVVALNVPIAALVTKSKGLAKTLITVSFFQPSALYKTQVVFFFVWASSLVSEKI